MQPRVSDASTVAAQSRREMASWPAAGCGHAAQVVGGAVVGDGEEDMARRLTPPGRAGWWSAGSGTTERVRERGPTPARYAGCRRHRRPACPRVGIA